MTMDGKAVASDDGGALVMVESPLGAQPFALHSLSADGATGRLAASLVSGVPVSVLFGADRRVPARIRWVRPPMLGIGFDAPLAADLLAVYARTCTVRAARHRMARVVSVSSGGSADSAVIRNMSRGGMMIETALPLALGQLVDIAMDSDAPLAGQVRWARNGRVGIELIAAAAIQSRAAIG